MIDESIDYKKYYSYINLCNEYDVKPLPYETPKWVMHFYILKQTPKIKG